MRIIGVTTPVAPPSVRFTVAHGEHPRDQLLGLGYIPLRPLSTVLVDGEIVFTYLVRKAGERPQARRRRPNVVFDEAGPDEVPVTKQRVGAYAVVLSERGLLGTVNSSLTAVPGTWALPGGGVDPGESPAQAVVREVFEESGQRITIDRVLTLDSDHWVGRSNSGVLEDYHALRVVYGATCEAPSEPVVHDLGGSTERAGWVPWQSWRRLHWTISSRNLLARYVGQMALDQSLK
ncbi:NUDIX domain-containing protein [Tessaracoccus rhinocerotis]|uniref:NUDIX domain-containing protein n=1 Tax=Tessaracoccus rhinocerotis TaxID=1689449 RepID=A0A553K1W2_9ACTN|nr:NUDIX domain-containing protein [Tessaracoccus rhinocerotis]TRY18693.1 NUDIX domain-containing protein [Tessaracoccus rhinocerotis]